MPSNTDAKPIRSRLVANISNDLESESVKDLERHMRDLIVGLDASTRDKCLARLGDVREARTKQKMQDLMNDIAPGGAEQRVKVSNSLSVLSFLVKALLGDSIPDGDHQYWADDLETLGWLDEESRPVFDSLLRDLVDERLPMLRVLDRQLRTEGGVLPNFNSIGITVEARAVRKVRYRWGMPLEGPKAYSPEVIGTAMVASVSIGLDEGFPEDMYFQIDETGIDNIIDSFVAAKMELAALRSYLNINSDGIVERDG